MDIHENEKIFKEFTIFLESLSNRIFDLSIIKKSNSKDYSELLASKRQLDIQLIARKSNGSHIAFWRCHGNLEMINSPIIFLDGEGMVNSVIASNLKDFLSILPYGTGGIFDILIAWDFYNEDSESYGHPKKRISKKELSFYKKACKKDFNEFAKFIKWLKAKKISVSKNPVKLIGESIASFPTLNDWITT